ncbi:MAG: DUF4340 domain-containing protein [Cyclobacteriaceae bacterium]|nr:DUF4340 domain-containing protein [Cyclobacteriaceae bacterium]
MQEKQNIRLLIGLVISSLALIVVVYISARENFDVVDKQLFQVEDQTEINKVVIKPAQGEEVELDFEGGRWRVNNTYDADQQMIKILFATLLQTEPRRQVATTIQDSISNHIHTTGQAVELYANNNLVKTFWVGGNDRKTETWFQLPNDVPYVVQVPGYRLYIASVFELTPSDWRDKRVFNFNWQNFKRLEMHFSKQSNQDFTVSLANQLFVINEVAVADTTKLSNYLESVFNLQANQFLTTPGKYDSLLATTPAYSISVTDIANRVYQLEVFPQLKGEQVILGRVNEELPALFSKQQITPIERKRSYFEY